MQITQLTSIHTFPFDYLYMFLGIVRLNMLFVRPSVGLTIGASVDQ